MKYRVVNTDNFDDDYPDESFVTPDLSEDGAKKIATILNEECNSAVSMRYWKVVPYGYTLVPGFEP